MPPIIYQGRVYRVIIGSDLTTESGGMFLEMEDPDGDLNPILYAYRSDEDRAITISMNKPNVPLELVQAFLESVRIELTEK